MINNSCKIYGRLKGGKYDKLHDICCRVYETDYISPTVVTCRGGNQELKIAEQNKQIRIRKLTPCECFKLMGFDEEDYIKASKVNSNSQLYKQAGNSIVVNVLEKIFENLI